MYGKYDKMVELREVSKIDARIRICTQKLCRLVPSSVPFIRGISKFQVFFQNQAKMDEIFEIFKNRYKNWTQYPAC